MAFYAEPLVALSLAALAVSSVTACKARQAVDTSTEASDATADIAAIIRRLWPSLRADQVNNLAPIVDVTARVAETTSDTLAAFNGGELALLGTTLLDTADKIPGETLQGKAEAITGFLVDYVQTASALLDAIQRDSGTQRAIDLLGPELFAALSGPNAQRYADWYAVVTSPRGPSGSITDDSRQKLQAILDAFSAKAKQRSLDLQLVLALFPGDARTQIWEIATFFKNFGGPNATWETRTHTVRKLLELADDLGTELPNRQRSNTPFAKDVFAVLRQGRGLRAFFDPESTRIFRAVDRMIGRPAYLHANFLEPFLMNMHKGYLNEVVEGLVRQGIPEGTFPNFIVNIALNWFKFDPFETNPSLMLRKLIYAAATPPLNTLFSSLGVVGGQADGQLNGALGNSVDLRELVQIAADQVVGGRSTAPYRDFGRWAYQRATAPGAGPIDDRKLRWRSKIVFPAGIPLYAVRTIIERGEFPWQLKVSVNASDRLSVQ